MGASEQTGRDVTRTSGIILALIPLSEPATDHCSVPSLPTIE